MAYVRVDVLVDVSQADNLALFLEAYPELVNETVQDAWYADIEPELMSDLQYYPGPSLNSLNSGTPFV
jgi:hypothetical protein